MAARATFDLNTGVWFRRGRLLIVSPVRGHHRRYQAETPLIPLSRFAEPALNDTRCAAENVMLRVALFCRSSSLTYVRSLRVCGSGTSSAVTMYGPSGVEVSKFLPEPAS